MTETLIAALKITGVGMAGIFFFMLIIGIMITALHRFFPAESSANNPTENS